MNLRMSFKYVMFIFFILVLGITNKGEAQDLVIFNKEKLIAIPYMKCGNDKAQIAVKVDKENGTINWKWEDKEQVWCGWGTESLPENDLTKYLSGNLVIKFRGSYQGKAPEIKFIDFNDIHTKIVSMSSYITGDIEEDAIAKIPLNKFGMDKEFSADPAKIRTIQFDAEYNSIRGVIKITEIVITPN